MRTKQTARKSTGTSLGDPIRSRHDQLLQTKRKSTTPSGDKKIHGKGKGKQISYDGRGKHIDGVKVKPRSKPGMQVLKDIKRYQKSTDLLIPRLPFHRLVREITQGIDLGIRYQVAALEALQEAAEYYLVRLFEDSYLCTVHAKRVTLMTSDLSLCRRLQGAR